MSAVLDLPTDIERTNHVQGDSLNDFLPSRWLHDGTIVNRDLSYSRGIRLRSPFALTSPSYAIDGCHEALRNAINSLPPTVDFQMLWCAHHDSSDLLRALDASSDVHDPLLKAFVASQRDALHTRFARRDLRFFNPYLFLTKKSRVSPSQANAAALAHARKNVDLSFFDRLSLRARLIFGSSEQLFQDDMDHAIADMAELTAIQTGFVRALNGAGCGAEPLSSLELSDLFFLWWNPDLFNAGSRPEPINEALLRPFSTYFVKDGLTINPDTHRFLYGGYHHAILTMSLPPKSLFTANDPLSIWDNLLSFARRSDLTLTVHGVQGNIEKRKEDLNTKRGIFEAQSRRKKELLLVVAEIERELLMLQQGEEKFWTVQVTAHLWHRNDDDLSAHVRDFVQECKRLGGLEMIPEQHNTFHYFLSAQPGWTRDKDRFRQVPCVTSQMLGLSPLVHTPTLTDRPLGALLETMSGTPYNFNPFDDREYANANGLIAGGSGFGKTFLVQLLVAQFLARGIRVFIIDPKGDFEALTRSVAGAYLNYHLDGVEMRTNPLALKAGQELPSHEEMDEILSWLESLLTDRSQSDRLPTETTSLLESLLNQAYRKAQGKELFLRDLQRLLNSTPGGETLATRLVPWVTTGTKANLFDGPTQPDLSRLLTVFDIGPIKDRPDIGRVALMSIMRQITLLAKRDPNRRYVLFLDECWALLKDPVVATFVESAFRLSRSLGGGVFGISQGMSEWTSLPNADAIIQNSSHRILLRQASEDSITKAEEKLTLNQREIAHLRSLQTIKGQYSQQLFHHVVASGGYRSSLVVTRPWPLLYALCTSNPRDKDAKRALAEQGLSFAEVITKFAELYPNGA